MNGNHAVGLNFHFNIIFYFTFLAEIVVARLQSLKRNVERGWEEKDLGLLQDHAVIW